MTEAYDSSKESYQNYVARTTANNQAIKAGKPVDYSDHSEKKDVPSTYVGVDRK